MFIFYVLQTTYYFSIKITVRAVTSTEFWAQPQLLHLHTRLPHYISILHLLIKLTILIHCIHLFYYCTAYCIYIYSLVHYTNPLPLHFTLTQYAYYAYFICILHLLCLLYLLNYTTFKFHFHITLTHYILYMCSLIHDTHLLDLHFTLRYNILYVPTTLIYYMYSCPSFIADNPFQTLPR